MSALVLFHSLRLRPFFALLLCLLLAACGASPGGSLTAADQTVSGPTPSATVTPTASTVPVTPTETAVPPTGTPAAVPSPSPAPLYAGTIDPCGLLVPLATTTGEAEVQRLSPDPEALAALRDLVPEAAQPALQQILAAPDSVSLAAYRVGAEDQGVFLNAQQQVPLASVVKLLHLVAYAEAVGDGRLSATATVPLADLEAFYLPTLDLRAHRDAVQALEDDGRLFGEPQALLLDEVVRMMIEYSANSATDYIHFLFGQETIEATAQALGLAGQTAPCPFLGQFLTMANHTRPEVSGRSAWQTYQDDPARYGREVMELTAVYSEDEAFRDEAVAWRRATRRPTVTTQRLFSASFNGQGTAAAYADLMARLAQNGLSSGESSFIARRHLEWPMQFEENQERFSNLGFKGGALPGILNVAYYGYPLGDAQPVVVALFYHDLPESTYRSWSRSQAHDEFARWLLVEPQALPALGAVLTP